MTIKSLIAGLFVEDEGHRALIEPLLARLARDEGVGVRIHVRTATGGLPRVLRTLKQYVADVNKGIEPYHDLLVVAIDGNCVGAGERSAQIRRAIGKDSKYSEDQIITAVPDPHVERWYLADSNVISTLFGGKHRIQLPGAKCERALYKRILRDSLQRALDAPPPAGGIMYGEDIANVMDLELACRNARDLGAFVKDMQGMLRRFRGTL